MLLHDLQVRKLKRLFDMHDVDKNGYLDENDFSKVAKNYARLLGWTETSKEYQQLHGDNLKMWDSLRQFADKDHDGKLTLGEFIDHWAKILADKNGFEMLLGGMTEHEFEGLDRDHDGFAKVEDYVTFFAAHDAPENLARETFALLDLDKDGRVSKAEHHTAVRDFFLATTPEAPGNWALGKV